MLSNDMLRSLLAPASPDKRNALVRLADGNLEMQEVKSSQFGKFEGRAGTKRRSRKGLVRTMPNGYRRYNDVTDVEVVAYTV